MKNWIKIAAVTGAILCGAGGITALAAMGLGAKPGAVNISEDGIRYITADSMEENWERWEEGIEHKWEHMGERWEHLEEAPELEQMPDEPAKMTENIPVQSFLPESISKIDVELLSGAVEIVSIPEGEIQIEIDEQAQKRGVFIHEKGGELKVCQRRREFLQFQNEPCGTVQIGIPETMVINQLECELDAGSCAVEHIQARSMDLSTEAGVIEASGVRTEDLDVSAEVGGITFEGAVERKIEGDCGVGELILRLEGKKEDFNYDIETGVGNVQIEDSQYSGLGLEEKIDNRSLGAVKVMELEVGTGSAEVSFY